MRRRNITVIRFFKCPSCGLVVTAPKYAGKTNQGHIKTMWCFNCAKEQDFIQIDSEKTK